MHARHASLSTLARPRTHASSTNDEGRPAEAERPPRARGLGPLGRHPQANLAFRASVRPLLELDGGAGLLELLLELVGLVALDAFLDGLRGLVDEGLGLLQA